MQIFEILVTPLVIQYWYKNQTVRSPAGLREIYNKQIFGSRFFESGARFGFFISGFYFGEGSLASGNLRPGLFRPSG
jgi:hypothetical protein